MTADEAVTEIHWVAHEARALATEHVDPDSERWQDYLNRKRALLKFIEVTL